MAKSADKAAKAEAQELARLEKRLDKARAAEAKRTRKAEKASDKVAKLAGKVAARRNGGSAASVAHESDADPVTDSGADGGTAAVADGASPADPVDTPARHDANEAQG